MISADVLVKVQFYDLDPMKVVWHGNYPRYLEIARCALLDKIGYNYPQMDESGFMWPIVDMQLKYVRPARFAQDLKITAKLREYENRLRIDYLITDAQSGQKLTKAQTTQVAVDAKTGELSFVSPQDLIRRVQAQL